MSMHRALNKSFRLTRCRIYPVLAALAAVAGAARAADETAVTIYSSARPGAISPELYRPLPGRSGASAGTIPGYAVVQQERSLKLETGRSTLHFTDVAALIDPTTVTFTALTDPATRVLAQNFQFDLVSTDKLLQKYVDHVVTAERANGASVSGTLLSSADGLVLRASDGGITALRDYTLLHFADLPGGLITRPTLVWELNVAKGGEQRARVTYQTGGMTWWADYNLTFTPGASSAAGTVDLTAWVSVINQSGASFVDARLKLVAGDVHRAQPAPQAFGTMALDKARREGAGFAEQALDEYHLYTLGRATTLPNNATQQIELFDPARRVPAQRLYVYAGAPQGYAADSPLTDRAMGRGVAAKVQSLLSFRNDKASGLGLPLPAGRIRVSRLDPADGSLEFIGEDVVDHTPRDETVTVKLGSAFDIVAERRQVAFTVDSNAHWMEEEIEVELRNHKSEAVQVQVQEGLFRWAGWSIVSASGDWQKLDARRVVFPVKLAADGHGLVHYRVRYSW